MKYRIFVVDDDKHYARMLSYRLTRTGRRKVARDRMFVAEEAKWQAIVTRIAALHEAGRPVLVGTRSVANSERLSAALTEAGVVSTGS